MATEIHETAIIDPGAELADGVTVGPYCIVGKDARIGSATRLAAHVMIEGNVTIGENCQISAFTTIGLAPQDSKYKGEDTSVVIGNNNVIREYISIHRASMDGDGKTEIGDDNFLMGYVHIAHDCKIGNKVIMANGAMLSGHTLVENSVVLGGMSGVHQHVRIGTFSMVGGMSRLTQDVPPYVIVSGNEKARPYGLNSIGLKRSGFSDETISELKKAYKIIFRQKISMKEAIRQVQAELPYTDEIRHLVEFIQQNKRGICR